MATQRTTKKNFASTRKAPKPRKITFGELSDIVADIAASHAKTEATVDRVSIEVEKLSVENQKTSAENREMEKALKETLRSVAELSDYVKELSKNVDNLSRNVGHVNNKLGSLVEYVVIPQIRHSINTVGGHSFTNIIPDVKIRDIINNEKKDVSQIDVFLYNDTEAMAVEIKTDLHVGDVNDHLKRLKKLRKYEEKPGLDLVRKKLFGAVVGIVIDGRAETLALENGLYVVKIHEDEELLDITKPDTCQIW